MVSVIVAAGDKKEIGATGTEEFRINDPLSDANMWFVGVGVFFGQRIRKIGIEQYGTAVLSDEKTALAKPPEAAATGLEDPMDICQEGGVLLKRGFHLTQPKFPADDAHAFDHVFEFLFGCPASGLA